ncbi:MAG: glycosyltransferase, partial [Candidatus Magasanikbacteria bacterium]|nr:glycosyltransferase [Candidatus Magasanikbacteria bacterium]
KYKILEAMATKTPIVGTPLAIEGINIIANQQAYVASTAKNLADKTVHLLKNPHKSKDLAENAYKLVSQEYNWKKISDRLDEVYMEVGQN